MTKQEYYDLLVAKALDGTMPSIEGTACLYWTPQGNACAIGLLLPDGHPGQHYFGPVGDLLAVHKDLRKLMPEGLTEEDLEDIQNIHDSCAKYERHSAESFARRFVRKLNSYLAFFADVKQTPWESLS